MYTTSSTYKTAINRHEPQHLRGSVTLLDGEIIELDDSTLQGSPRYEKRCTASEDGFAIGELYTGTAELTLLSETLLSDRLRGAKMRLEFAAGESEYIPIGEWTVTEPERRDPHTITVRGEDCISRLDVPITDNSVGNIDLAAKMRVVTELTGVEFAQTPEELRKMFTDKADILSNSFEATCRQEVISIAQLLGGFACADRFGRIEFRRFGTSPAAVIEADMRHSATLSEYTFGVSGVGFTDKYGHTTIVDISVNSAAKSRLMLTGNKNIWNRHFRDSAAVGEYDLEYLQKVYAEDREFDLIPEADIQYLFRLLPLAERLSELPVWTPGEVRYYGDPSIDLGDLLTLSGGITGGSAAFLVTADYWEFRAPQTLISAGAGAPAGNGSGTSGTSASSSQTTVTVSKIVTVELEEDEQPMPGGLTQYAAAVFSCRSDAVIMVMLTAILSANADTAAEIHVLFDGVMQTVFSRDTLRSGEVRTVSLNVPLTAEQGRHTVTAEVTGGCDILRLTACAVGQDLTAEDSELTLESDFTWKVRDGLSTVTGYTGTAERVRIPQRLGGGQVTVIGDGSFAETGITTVKIPEGTEVIE